MPANKKLLILPGDGIGPEVMREVRRVIDWMDRRRRVSFDISDDLVGGASIDARGTPIADETMQKAKDTDAILFGSVGGPKWDTLGFQLRPELAILRLRKELDLFANLRPATVLDPLVGASTLKPEVVRGLDLMIVRESTGGIYFGEPRGIETLPNGEQRGFDTESYTTSEIERVARVAFELAPVAATCLWPRCATDAAQRLWSSPATTARMRSRGTSVCSRSRVTTQIAVWVSCRSTRTTPSNTRRTRSTQ